MSEKGCLGRCVHCSEPCGKWPPHESRSCICEGCFRTPTDKRSDRVRDEFRKQMDVLRKKHGIVGGIVR